MNEFDYFSSSLDEINFLDSDGNIIANKEEYFKKLRMDMLTYTNPLKIGDVVKLKTTGDVLIVKHTNYEIMGLVYDYAGVREENASDNLVLFCQEDIEYNLSESKVRR